MFIPLPLFWGIHAQQGSRWVFQATKMNGDIGWYSIKADQMIVLNSLFALILIPMFESWFYALLSRVGIRTPLRRIVLGGILLAIAFIAAALVQLQAERNFISILWMIPQYLIMAAGEVLVYTANLNFSYTEAPQTMKSVMMSFMTLSVAGGCLIVTLISGVALFDSQVYEFLFFAGILLLDVGFMAFLATRYEYVGQPKIRDLS